MDNIQEIIALLTPIIQEMIALLTPITLLITAVAGLLAAITSVSDHLGKLWPRLQTSLKGLLLLATQIVPIGMIIWYFMYWVVQYPGRFTEPVAFLLLVVEPTILIIAYEWLYPKLLSFVRQEVNARQSSDTNLNENSKQKSDSKLSSNKKHQ
jgi:hypothetical protein